MSTEHNGPEPETTPAPGLSRGSHICADRPGGIRHDGIYLGDDRVIHMASMPGQIKDKRGASVQITTLAAFAAGQPVTVRPYVNADDPDVIIERAMSRLGDGDYNLLFNNCQHFAHWCVTGERLSEQVNAGTARTGAVLAPAIGMPVGIALVGSAGLASGLSGPGIMSGLARYGSITGGGAVSGLLLLGLATGGATLVAMNTELRDDRFLPENERAARTAGRIGSAVGLAAGSAGTALAVSTLGTPGLSGAGITSGLAALGSVFGGGMKAGTKCAIVIPALTAIIFGYAAYTIHLHRAEAKTQVTEDSDL